MAFQYLTQLFTGGMNQDLDAAAIDLTMQDQSVSIVATSQNMVFERGLAMTRLGLSALPGPPSSLPSNANLRAVRWLPVGPRSLISTIKQRGAFAITDAPKLYSLQGDQSAGNVMTPVEVTGAGFTQSSGYYCDNTVANGVVLIAGNQSGLIRWDPTGTTYTIVSDSPYQYVCGHLSRAVAAFDLSSSSPGRAQTVAWSAAGDEAVWSGSTSGAGLTVLSDATDSITGLKVAKGTVVVARAYGFHLGIPTGQFPAVYDWRKVDDISVGCMHPASLVVYKNTLFFMSECGIHTFDLVDVEDIGEGIYQEINTLIRQYGLIARGFISTGYKPDFQPSYNIILDSSQSLTGTPEGLVPHFMFNIREKKWSRHFYVNTSHATAWTPLLLGAEYLPSGTPVDPPAIPFLAVYQRVQGSVPTLLQWNVNQTLDTAASFTTGKLTLQDPSADAQLERFMLIYNCPASAGITFTATVTYILNGVAGSTSVDITTYASGGWDRRWFNLRVSGNMDSVKITFPIGTPSPVFVKALILEYTVTGRVRT